MEQAEVKRKLDSAIGQLYKQDIYLLEKGVHERSLTFRLGFYLQHLFEDWHVDCEYNRKGDDPKRNSNGNTVYPDIIVHKRGPKGPNLLVIEAKPDPIMNSKKVLDDLDKLRRYKKDQKYQFTAFLKLYTGNGCKAPEYCWI